MLARYQALRSVDVLRLQNAALERDGVVRGRAASATADQLPPEQFMYSMLTRSQRISHENLRLRDKAWLEGYERWFAARAGLARGRRTCRRRRRCSRPTRVRGVTLKNRVVVSPMAQYSASTACPATTTWCTWARARWAAPAWWSPR